MNYDDELERAKARRSRKREESAGNSGARSAGTTRTSSTVRSTQNGERTVYRRRKKKKKTGKIVLGVILGLLAVIAAVGIGVYMYFGKQVDQMDPGDFSTEKVQNINISQEKREQMEKGFLTVAVFGVDSRDNSLGKGNQSDVIMIANLNRETGEIKLVSVFRDTYLNISDKNTYNKINAAYASGGPEAAVKAINKNMDLNITHYATFNWKAVATVINILGGVEIDISKSEFYYINAFITETVKGTGIGSVQLDAPGVHNLDGVQAVAYGRLRLMDSDYARTERQRIILQKAFEKLKAADLATINSVVGHVMEMSATNIKWEELLSLATGIKKYHLGETTGFPSARGEVKIKIGENKLSCVIPQTLESNVISIHNFLYGEENYVPSNTVKEISAKIAEVSGLASAGEEIGHVAVDQGYIPKKTTTAAPETTKAPETQAESTEAETAEVSSEGESESASEGESESGSESGESGESTTVESGSEAESEDASGPARPGTLTGPGSNGPAGESTSGADSNGPGSRPGATTGPQGPSDQTSASTEALGPGSKPQETTAGSGPNGMNGPDNQTSGTLAPGNALTSPSGTTAPTTGASSPSGNAPSNSAPSGTTISGNAPGNSQSGSASSTAASSSPADVNISSGNGSGPAAQATTAAAPGV